MTKDMCMEDTANIIIKGRIIEFDSYAGLAILQQKSGDTVKIKVHPDNPFANAKVGEIWELYGCFARLHKFFLLYNSEFVKKVNK